MTKDRFWFSMGLVAFIHLTVWVKVLDWPWWSYVIAVTVAAFIDGVIIGIRAHRASFERQRNA